MTLKKVFILIISVSLMSASAACSASVAATPAPTPTVVWQEGMPREGQPQFPKLGQYWIIDNGCGFDNQKVVIADAMFEKLRTDGIAEVAIICQSGVVDKGATNNDKIWLRDWARWAKMGSTQDNRSVVWLIRPDAKPEEASISIEVSRWLYWYTAIDYAEGLQEASNYAHAGDFNGALVSIARNTDEKLRALWVTHQSAPTPVVTQ
jgi:hypothetical protein